MPIPPHASGGGLSRIISLKTSLFIKPALILAREGKAPGVPHLQMNGGDRPPSATARHRQRRPCTLRRRRAMWRQAEQRQGRCAISAAPPVEARAPLPLAGQGERQERQRVSPKTPHPQGAKRERVRPQKIPLTFARARSLPEGPNSKMHLLLNCGINARDKARTRLHPCRGPVVTDTPAPRRRAG